MNVVMNDVLIMIIMKWMMCNNERVDRLLRSLNTLDGRDVIELYLREYYECNIEWCVDYDDNDRNAE